MKIVLGAIAIEQFVALNKSLIQTAEREKNDTKRLSLYMQQAIYVHELSTVILNIIERLTTHGIDELRKLCKEKLAHLAVTKNKAQKWGKDVQLDDWADALNKIEKNMNATLFKADEQERELGSILDEREEEFENLRRLAAIQLEILMHVNEVNEFAKFRSAVEKVATIPAPTILRLNGETIDT